MASDDRPTDELKPRRRGKAPVITLEAREIEPTTAADPAADPAGETAHGATAGQEGPVPGEASASETIDTMPVAPASIDEADKPSLTAASGVDETADAAPAEPAAPETPSPEPASFEAAPPDATPAHVASSGSEQSAPPRPDYREDPQLVVPPPSGGGFGRLAAAGLVGALITGGLGIAAQMSGYWPGTARQDTSALEQRLAALDGQVRQIAARPAAPSAPAVDLAPLTRRIESLDAARASLEGRLAAIEQRPAATAGQSPPQQSAAIDLDPLKTEIDALKVAVEAIASAQRTAAQSPPAAPAAPAVDMTAVEARVAALLAPQTERVDATAARIRSLDEEIKATSAAARALGEKVTTLETARSQAGDAGRRAALVVGLSSLRGAFDRGQSFAAELKSAATLGLPAEAVRSLEAHAERGLPTSAALAQRFSALVPALLRAAPARATDGTLLDRLSATAQNLVRVRPVGEAAGDDVPTAVSRAEAKLRRGDIAGALADIDRLPEPVRALAASWAAEARARVAAEATLRRLTLDATAALTGG
ncbi:COG4223 family protein [Phreatobacter sp. HK31-P]